MSNDRELAFLLNDCVKVGEQLKMREGWFLIQDDENFPKTVDEYNKKYPNGSKEQMAINGFAYWTEMMGLYTRKGWIPEEVTKEFISIQTLWPKIEPMIKDMRKKYGMDGLYVDTEYLAKLG